MHHLMLVTLSLAEYGTSDEARCAAHSLLLEDKTFCGEGGRFGAPLCDWFVLGGRWSGLLSKAKLGQPYQDALAAEFPQFTKGSFSSKLIEEHKVELDRLWHRCGGKAGNPLTRSGYHPLGFDDDAMIVDQMLYARFLKPHAGSIRNTGGDGLSDFADLDGDEVDESFIGDKWLIVVDYHR